MAKSPIASKKIRVATENMRRNIYFKFKNEFFHVGELTNRVTKLEIIFKPSIKFITGGTLPKKTLADHFTFHFSGRAHLKDSKKKYDIFNANFEKGKTIADLDFAIFFTLLVKDLNELPKHTTLLPGAMVFDVKDVKYQGIEVSLATGLFLVKNKMQVSNIKVVTKVLNHLKFIFGGEGTGHENTLIYVIHFLHDKDVSEFTDSNMIITESFRDSIQFK